MVVDVILGLVAVTVNSCKGLISENGSQLSYVLLTQSLCISQKLCLSIDSINQINILQL